METVLTPPVWGVGQRSSCIRDSLSFSQAALGMVAVWLFPLLDNASLSVEKEEHKPSVKREASSASRCPGSATGSKVRLQEPPEAVNATYSKLPH